MMLTAMQGEPSLANSKKKIKKKQNSNPTKTEKNRDDRLQAKATDQTRVMRFGLGAGLQSIYPPSLGIETVLDLGSIQASGEFGFFRLSQAEFSGSTSFFGVSARWLLNPSQPFFIGASVGIRNISLTTGADLSYTDETSGRTTTTTIAWTRKVSQTLLYPKVGWMWKADKSAFVASAGLMLPIGSKASISGNPPSAEGISQEDYQSTAYSKLNEVTKTTNSMMPSLELKYLRFFN